jgi:ankyrin repeat protein
MSFRVFLCICLGTALVLPAFSAAADDPKLVEAAMKGDPAVVRSLISQGADVNAPGKDGTPALHWVVRRDDVETASALLKAGANAKFADRYGVTPLALACANGNARMIALLLDAGANPNAADPAGSTPLMTVVTVGDVASVKLLLGRGANVNAKEPGYDQTPLMMAVLENYPEVVRVLVENGADLNAKTRTGPTPEWFKPNSSAAFGHGIGINRGGLPDRGSRLPIQGSMTALLYAARDGRLDIVKTLVEAKADVNQAEANAITPLVIAINNNQFPVARYLVDHGADLKAADWYGRTPIWSAVETRNMDIHNATFAHNVDRDGALELIQVLLDRGADPNVRTKEVPPTRRHILPTTGSLSWVDFTGQTPFLTAALSGDVTVMRLLLRYGADPNIPTFQGTTPLMAAAGINWVFFQTFDEGPEKLLEAVKLCLELGGDINGKNSMGLTPIMGAANRGSDDIIQFLVNNGALLDIKDKEGRTPLNWAEGVFLATNPAKPKPSSMELIQKLAASTK